MKKAFFAAIIAAALWISGNVFAVLSGGGTEANPYLIQSRADFDEFANPINAGIYWASGKYTSLMCDLNLSGTTYTKAVIASDVSTSSGFQGTKFTGVFDGNGHTISNLTINASTKDFIGLFGYVGSSGKISNLSVENVDITGSSYVGGLEGINDGSLTSCYTTGSVSGNSSVGGLVGYNYYGLLTSCYATGSVSGTGNYIGGLVGNNASDSTLISCYATGSVSGTGYVGGLVGWNYQSTLTSCYAIGLVTGNYGVGGLVGSNNGSGSITGCFWDTETSGQETSAGGEGKTTTQMQIQSIFTDAGWDFVGESVNGHNDYWQMAANDYPRFAIHTWTLVGEGTSANPYVVANSADLGKVWLRLSAYYRLGGNLDLTGIQWSSAVVPVFTGVFDGQRFVISHLMINQPGSNYVGLFGRVGDGGQIRNLGVENDNITGRSSVGGLVGNNDYGSLTSCYATGLVSGTGRVGGLVGWNDSGTLSDSYAVGSVSGTGDYVGGLVGYNYSGSTITGCYATDSVSGNSYVGGLVGDNWSSLTSCYSTGSVSGTGDYVGGLVGNHYSGTLTGCFWDIQTSGTSDGVGNYYTDPAGVTGKTTAEMMMLSTFTSPPASWDFTNEITNGTDDYWMMLREGEDYPRLAWQPVYPEDIAGLYGINVVDYAEIAAHWGQTGCPTGCENADINGDGTVDIVDLMSLANNWLEGR